VGHYIETEIVLRTMELERNIAGESGRRSPILSV
jgi:hypothetical protein